MHDLNRSLVLSLVSRESSHHQRTLSVALQFVMCLAQSDTLVQDYLCICKSKLRAYILSCMILGTNEAALCTSQNPGSIIRVFCKFFNSLIGKPYSKELLQSSLDVTKAWMSFQQLLSFVRYFRTRWILRK